MNSGKIRNLLKDNKGETILEVVVAFTLLTIMMVLFSQGIKYATMTNLKADETRNDSDKAMEELQKEIASDSSVAMPVGNIDGNNVNRKRYVVTVEGKEYSYIVYSVDG
ncbi:MAG: hypothetical protein IKG03_02680 [Clostridiales bacterium]|nr:hypothetical protein [Clostridiales bacterium]